MDFPTTPLSYLHPVFDQPRGHAGVVRDAVFPTENAAGNNRPDEDWEDIPPPIEYTATQGQPQHLQYVDMGYYDIANDPPQHEHRDHAINNCAGVALEVPAQAQAAPPDPVCADLPFPHTHIQPRLSLEEIGVFGNPALNAAAGPVPNVQVNELLRQLAILYLREPNSRIAEIRMEPGPGQVHGVRVYIALDLL